MNKVYCYNPHLANDSIVQFLFFDTIANLISTENGILNITNVGVWECEIPIILTEGEYTVIVKSNNIVLGKEEIYWDSEKIIPKSQIYAKAVREELNPEIIHLVSLTNGLTINQSTMLLELYRLMGLDPTKPLFVSKNQRIAGDEIKQRIDDNHIRTIITRE